MKVYAIGISAAAFFLIFSAQAQNAQTDAKAKKIFEKLTGTPLLESDPRLKTMSTMISQNKMIDAAKVATEDDYFYNDTVKNFALPLTNKDFSGFADLNDMAAMFVGAARDQMDARELLTGDFIYYGGGTKPTFANNTHFENLDKNLTNLRKTLVKASPQYTENKETSGIFTSRGWAKAHYIMGTNRRAVEYTFNVFMCRPIESMMDFTISDEFVRRDVDRQPGGVYKTYQTRCVGCHAGIDALGGAFARFDFVNENLTYYPSPNVAPKVNINNHVYPAGAVVSSDSWENLWLYNQNELLGWRGPTRGKGLKEFATMIANSKGFSTCMAQRVFSSICNRDPKDTERKMIEAAGASFETNKYNLKSLFEEIAVLPSCLGE